MNSIGFITYESSHSLSLSHTHTHTYIYISTQIKYIYIYIYVGVFVYVCVCGCVCGCAHACVCVIWKIILTCYAEYKFITNFLSFFFWWLNFYFDDTKTLGKYANILSHTLRYNSKLYSCIIIIIIIIIIIANSLILLGN